MDRAVYKSFFFVTSVIKQNTFLRFKHNPAIVLTVRDLQTLTVLMTMHQRNLLLCFHRQIQNPHQEGKNAVACEGFWPYNYISNSGIFLYLNFTSTALQLELRECGKWIKGKKKKRKNQHQTNTHKKTTKKPNQKPNPHRILHCKEMQQPL